MAHKILYQLYGMMSSVANSKSTVYGLNVLECSTDGNLWLVKLDGLILQPMASTNHKSPSTEHGAFIWTEVKFTVV